MWKNSPHFVLGSKFVQKYIISYFCQIAESCHIHTPISRKVNTSKQNHTLTSWGRSHNIKKLSGLLFFVQHNKIYFMYNVCVFWGCSCPNSPKMAKITWPVSMATRYESHKFDNGFWLFAQKDTSCANFIKIWHYLFPPTLGPYREHVLKSVKSRCKHFLTCPLTWAYNFVIWKHKLIKYN